MIPVEVRAGRGRYVVGEGNGLANPILKLASSRSDLYFESGRCHVQDHEILT